jgi:hypothetical protein
LLFWDSNPTLYFQVSVTSNSAIRVSFLRRILITLNVSKKVFGRRGLIRKWEITEWILILTMHTHEKILLLCSRELFSIELVEENLFSIKNYVFLKETISLLFIKTMQKIFLWIPTNFQPNYRIFVLNHNQWKVIKPRNQFLGNLNDHLYQLKWLTSNPPRL